ncbi:hypothetical protein DFH08DRAFT_723079 [Mycena albidolilacea]|uniref:Uncharacterized protein n=1 Tax=Mycena albidolilacea TaxID=1033008 RepID=A0AAD6YZM2_9AGAR|nr:hypothetical protein DFH08DRAFT_723079 [Mycena albidolilacea]
MRKNSDQANCLALATGEIHSLKQKHEDEVKQYEARVETLARERGSYRSELKQLRASTDSCPPPPKTGPISLDPFDNKLDQVSEAMIKSSVESLNDSLDTFTMTLVDEAEELAKQNSYSSLPCALQEADRNNRLMVALQEHSHVEESRGFLLDATFHSSLVSELDNLFFSGDVVSRAMDSHGLFALALHELTMREPWTVVQRWRALAATTHTLDDSNEIWKNSIISHSESFVSLLAFSYRQPLQAFAPLLPQIRSRLEALYTEASQLSAITRRDMLSVRMAVAVAPTDPGGIFLPYNADWLDTVWSDMEMAESDEIIGQYRFGLQKTDEKGQLTLLTKPEVVRTALLREMAKNIITTNQGR